MATAKMGLPLITGNMTADVVRDLNALANDVDAKVASLADLDAVNGTSNASVTKAKSARLDIDTRSQVLTYTGGQITKVEEKDGAAVIKTTTLAYNATSGRLETVTEVAGGTTVTTTINYDGSGNIMSTTKAVA